MKKYTLLAAALIGGGVLTAPAHAQSMPELTFSGFGTIAAVHSSERNADFVGGIFQPNGAGYTHPSSFGPDSKVGGQLKATFNDKFSGVVQLVSQHQYDNSWTPVFEWANLKYQVTLELSLRAGRIALPTYTLSESRFVGYASPWVRAPKEVYGAMPYSTSDGFDASYRKQFGEVNNTVQFFYGKNKFKAPGLVSKANPVWGVSDSLEFGSLNLHASYTTVKTNWQSEGLSNLVGGLAAFGTAPGLVGAQGRMLADKYKLDDMKFSLLALGATYDPGNWFVMGEFASVKGAGFLSNSRSAYVSAGYRFGDFTPYVTYARAKADLQSENGIASPAAAGLNAGVNATLSAFAPKQHTVSAGVRWDFMKNVALKTQYDRITTSDGSSGNYANVQPGFVSGKSANVVTVALDFVF